MKIISRSATKQQRVWTGFLRRSWQYVLLVVIGAMTVQGAERLTINFNPDWKFIKADIPGAAAIAFDDRNWSDVSAPHTYNDTDTFDDWSMPGHRGEQNQWGGRTWYRKTFTLPKSVQGKKVFIEFQAVRQVAEVYLNGKFLGVSKTGFTPFGFDLTPYLQFDRPNILALMCDNRFMKDPPPSGTGSARDKVEKGPTLGEISAEVNAAIPDTVAELQANQIPWNNPHWHPAHGGIYRNVYLYITDPLHISLPLYSFLQTTGPYGYAREISDQSAEVTVEIPVQNERSSDEHAEISVEVLDQNGNAVLSLKKASVIQSGGQKLFKVSGIVKNPELWSPDYPYLYRVVCSISAKGEVVDSYEIPLGLRSVHWDTQTGFSINGHHLKLHGWGQKPTDEWPGLGVAQPDWLHFFTLNLMKEAGGNFIRWGHSAAGPASIAASDRLGFVVDQPGVDGESDTRGGAWMLRAEAFRDTLIYFRNHPSILIWEGGNQKVTREHAKELHDLVERYDPHGERAYAHRRADKKTAEFMNVGIGTEGGCEIKTLPVVEGEYDREESPRRVWDDFSPPNFGYPEAQNQSYDLMSEQYAVNQVAQYVRKLGSSNHCGGANWIFSDSTSGGRVACEVARASGEVDGVRLPKEAYYVCQAMFRSDPQIHIIGHWNYSPGTRKTVYMAANGDAVELFLNGQSLGKGIRSDCFLFTFSNVLWQAGELKAVSYRDGKKIAFDNRRTTGPAVALRLTPIFGPGGLQSDGSDVGLVDVEAIDANGERCPTFQQRVDFKLDGPAVWRGGYNSGKTNSINHEFLDLECGINRIAVRAGRTVGRITLRATCPGLKPASIEIQSAPFDVVGGVASQLPKMPFVKLRKEQNAELADSIFKGSSDVMAVSSAGRFTRSFSYSGPTTSVHVERNAQRGKKIYVDQDALMPELPSGLSGADWVQAANADSRYHAVDLMEFSVASDTVVSVAYDDRLPRPEWLQNQFTPTAMKLMLDGHEKTVFQHRSRHGESLTLGSNVEDSSIQSANMYVVFINRDVKPSVLQAESSLPKQNSE
ncbi:MAG TPA: DUF4982 domain-containing protein [Verrucomicrobiae bacterium]|nr:DUF4982 domain-containing protein [Verrucomicrobiae bacterium]